MYYTIYKITNKIDGKCYIGSHKTKNLNDGYMGSGKYLKYAQNKYGLDNFTKEILFIYDNPGDMYYKESEIVNEEFISTENTYNIKLGGFGGWDYLNETGLNNSTKSKDLLKKPGLIHKEKLLNDEEYRNSHCSKWNERLKKAHKEGKIRYDTMKGKKHSDSTKKLIGMKNSISQKGEKNSQFGTIWITNGVDSVRVKKGSFVPEGWNKGRKMKVSPS